MKHDKEDIDARIKKTLDDLRSLLTISNVARLSKEQYADLSEFLETMKESLKRSGDIKLVDFGSRKKISFHDQEKIKKAIEENVDCPDCDKTRSNTWSSHCSTCHRPVVI